MRFAVAGVLAAAALNATAAGLAPTGHPGDYCSIGAEAGLPTRPFNSSTGACASNCIDVGKALGRGGMVNNLAFYSMSDVGQPNKLQRGSMILNVNNPLESNASREILVKAASIVSKRILGTEPTGLAAAIRAGKNSA